MPWVESSFQDHIGTLHMNHPARRNALGEVFIQELVASLRDLVERKARVIVLRASDGTGTWSAGHDVHELSGQDPLAPDQPLPRLMQEVEACPVPVIAMIDGGVYGGAVELALCCDLRMGSEKASFSMPPARLALPYSATGLKRFLHVLRPPVAKELFYTASTIRAERALHLGLLDHLVPSAELEEKTYQMAEQIARNAPHCVRAVKATVDLLADGAPTQEALARIDAMRQEAFASRDFQEGLAAFREKRAPMFWDE